MQLDRPVALRRADSGTPASSDVPYVRHAPACFSNSTAFFIASAEQPATAWIPFNKDTTGLAPVLGRDSAEVPVVRRTRFDRVLQ